MMPIWGDGYKFSLGEYNEKSATGWFQLRLTLTDATGNEIDLSALPAGVYVVRAAAAGSVVTEKICVR